MSKRGGAAWSDARRQMARSWQIDDDFIRGRMRAMRRGLLPPREPVHIAGFIEAGECLLLDRIAAANRNFRSECMRDAVADWVERPETWAPYLSGRRLPNRRDARYVDVSVERRLGEQFRQLVQEKRISRSAGLRHAIVQWCVSRVGQRTAGCS